MIKTDCPAVQEPQRPRRRTHQEQAIRTSWRYLCLILTGTWGLLSLSCLRHLAYGLGNNLINLVWMLGYYWLASRAWQHRDAAPLWWAIYYSSVMEVEP